MRIVCSWSDRKTLAAGAMRDRVRVRDFEPAFLQIVAVIEHRTTDEERAFWIDNQTDIGGWNENVALFRSIDQIHRVLQTGAAAADHGETQRAIWISLSLEQRCQFACCLVRDPDQALIANLVIRSRCFSAH